MTYVYRLVITYPEGIDWRNPPENWVEEFIPPDDSTTFQWPRERKYLSERGAAIRAMTLRSYGCTVTVERSNPVTWPS